MQKKIQHGGGCFHDNGNEHGGKKCACFDGLVHDVHDHSSSDVNEFCWRGSWGSGKLDAEIWSSQCLAYRSRKSFWWENDPKDVPTLSNNQKSDFFKNQIVKKR